MLCVTPWVGQCAQKQPLQSSMGESSHKPFAGYSLLKQWCYKQLSNCTILRSQSVQTLAVMGRWHTLLVSPLQAYLQWCMVHQVTTQPSNNARLAVPNAVAPYLQPLLPTLLLCCLQAPPRLHLAASRHRCGIWCRPPLPTCGCC